MPRGLTGRGECSRSVIASITSSAAAMLFPVNRYPRAQRSAAVVGIVHGLPQRPGNGFPLCRRRQPRLVGGERGAGGCRHTHRKHPVEPVGL